mgnify:CR=1 FL=1
MKTTYILLSFLLSFSFAACSVKQNSIKGNTKMHKETRKLKAYDKVSLQGSFQINLVPGAEGNIAISAEENLIPYIQTVITGDQLHIQFESGYSYRPTEDIIITVPVEDLNEIKLVGSGDIKGEIPGKNELISLFLTGSGDLDLNIHSNEINSSLVGSGDIVLTGETELLATKLSGSGDFKAYDLKAYFIEATIKGSGDMELYPIQSIEAKVLGSGDIVYKGNPKKEVINVTGSGNVHAAH